MPSLALAVSALYLKSFATWLKLHMNDDGKKIKKKSLKVSKLFLEKLKFVKNIHLFASVCLQAPKNLNIMIVSAIMLSTHAVGAFIMPAGNYLVKKLPWSSEVSLLYSYIAISVISALVLAVVMSKFV